MSLDPVILAQDLIRCPSVTPNEAGALDLLQQHLQAMGFVCTRMPFAESDTPDVDNLYARLGTDGPNLCFAGHTDVVPEGVASQWSHPAFGGEIHDGKLYGRGAADMKGAIAAWVAAISRHQAKGTLPVGSLSFLITGDEEGPAINGTRKMLDKLDQMGEKLDACITGEPTNPEKMGEMIKIGRRGSLNATLKITGKQGHVGYAHLADNAAHHLVRICHELIGWEIDQGTAHFQPSTLSFTTIDIGNPVTNIIPGHATAAFNIRFNDLHTSASLIAEINAHIHNIMGESHGVEMDVRVSGESFLTPPDKLCAVVTQACEAITGNRPVLSTSGGTSDSRFIHAFCPVLDFGLVGKTMHQIDEHVATADIYALTDIYEKVITDFFIQHS